MLANRPLVSIGMPIFNGMRSNLKKNINLEKSLQSILKQSYKNLEIIISDNCSNDETINIIKKYLKKDKRIIFYKQKKKVHVIDNFKFVLAKSSGEYFKFNSHDDYISSDFIEKNLEFLIKNNDYIFSSSPFSYENDSKKKIIRIKSLDGDVYNRLKNFLKNAVFSQHCFYALFKKKYLEDSLFGNKSNQVKINKNIFCLDWLSIIQVLINGKFKTIKYGKLVIGTHGISNQIEYVRKKINILSENKFGILFRYIFPIIDFNVVFFLIISRLKNVSNFKKLNLNIMSFSYNWFFLKIIIKRILLLMK
jgi:glycosyltransferase involved in cell wall biosynthesis